MKALQSQIYTDFVVLPFDHKGSVRNKCRKISIRPVKWFVSPIIEICYKCWKSYQPRPFIIGLGPTVQQVFRTLHKGLPKGLKILPTRRSYLRDYQTWYNFSCFQNFVTTKHILNWAASCWDYTTCEAYIMFSNVWQSDIVWLKLDFKCCMFLLIHCKIISWLIDN